MKKHLLFCLSVVMLLSISIGLSGQVVVLHENFESGIPSTWTQQNDVSGVSWSSGTGGLTNVTAPQGIAYAYLQTSTQTTGVKLVSPLIDVSSLAVPELSYYVIQPANSLGNFDMLKVYYRLSTSDNWVLLQSESDEEAAWAQRKVSLEGLSHQNLQLAFEYNNESGRGVGLDSVVLGNQHFSVTPVGLNALRITEDGASLVCSASEYTLAYYLKVSTVAMTDLTQPANVANDTVYAFPHLLTGLQPNTHYYFYVQSDCGNGDVSDWSIAGEFTTLCSAMVLPINENFENGVLSGCWNSDFSYSGDWRLFTPGEELKPQCSSDEARGNYSFCLIGSRDAQPMYTSPRLTTSTLISPKIAIADMGQAQLTFWVKSASEHYVLTIGLMSDPMDMSTFVSAAQVKVAKAGVWEEVILPLPSQSDTTLKFVGFHVDGAEQLQTATFYIDDIAIDPAPACSKPSLVRALRVTPDGVNLNWAGMPADGWHVKLATAPMTSMSATADGKDTIVTSRPALLTGLQPSTTYYAYISSQCGTSQSAWSNVFEFTTACASIATFPVSEGFENNANGTFPSCWSRPVVYENYPMVINKSLCGSPKVLSMMSDIGSSSFAVTPAIHSQLNSLQMSFVLANQPNSSMCHLEVGYMIDPTNISTFVPVQTFTSSSTTPIEYTVTFDTVSLAGLDYYLAFKQQGMTDYDGIYIDDILIDSLSSCLAPNDVHTSQLGPTGATVTWSPRQGESQWLVKVSGKNYSRPSDGVGEFFDDTVSVNNIVLNKLTMGGKYYVYVKALCSDEYSIWERYTFETPCGDITELPFIEPFTMNEGFGTYVPCWSKIGAYSPSITTYMNATEGDDGSGALTMSASDYDPNVMAILPKFDVVGKGVADLQVSFAYRDNYLSIGTPIVVGVMTDPTDSTTFVAVDTLYSKLSNQFTRFYDIPLSSYNGTGQYVAFRVKLGLNTQYAIYGVLDDVRLDYIPACARVNSLRAEDVNDVDALVSWPVRDSETQWEAVIGRCGFDPSTGTAIAVTDTMCRFTGLTPNTEYDVYVRANCGTTLGMGLWSEPLKVKTTPIAEMLPIVTDFSDAADNSKWILNNGSQTNHWVIGTAATDSGKSLYVSVGQGDDAAYEYDGNVESYAYAYRYIHFNPGAYRIAYDWTAPFESYSDGARICLVTKATPVEAGQSYGMRSGNNKLPAGWVYDLSEGMLNNSEEEWAHQEQILTFTDTVNYKLVMFWKNYKYMPNAMSAAIDNLSVTELECVPASDVQALATDSSAELSWTRFDKVPLWDVRVDTARINPDEATNFIFSDSVTVNRVLVPNLMAQTHYYAYIRPHCSDGSYEAWTEYSFTTECSAVMQLPYEEDFENPANFKECWKTPEKYYSYPYVVTDQNHTFNGSRCLSFGNTSTATSMNVAVLPRIDADSIKNLIMSFQLYSESKNQKIDVGVMNNPSDVSSFVLLQTFVTTQTEQWQSMQMSFADYNGNGQYIVFKTGLTNAYNFLSIDDVRIEDNRNCKQPTAVNVSRLTNSSAKIAWSSVNSSCLYNLKVSSGEINPSVDQGDVLDETAIQDNFYMLQNALQPNTTYYVYVQSDCGDAEGSYWSKVMSFTTLCNASAVRYEENFELSAVNTLPACWMGNDELSGDVNASYLPKVAMVNRGDSSEHVLAMNAFYEKKKVAETWRYSSANSVAILPLFTDTLSDLFLQFDNMSGDANSVLKVGVLSDVSDMSTFTLVDTIMMGDWQQSSVSLSNYSGTGAIAFLLDGDRNKNSVSAYIDNVVVDYLTGCKPASLLWSENVDNQGCRIVWKPLTSADSVWHVQVTQFDAGSDVSQLDRYTDFDIDTVVTGNSLNVGGLMSTTTYYYYVRPVCQGVDGPRYASSKSFRTMCDATDLPYSENFDAYRATGEGSAMPECWLGFTNVNSDVNPYVINYGSQSAPNALYIMSTAGTYSYAVLPKFKIDSVNRLSISFSGYSNYSNSTMQLGVMTDPTDIRSFELLNTFMLQDMYTWETFSYSLSSYQGDGQYVVLRSMANDANYMLIDNVSIYNEEGCNPPSEVSVANITKNSAIVSWSKESIESAWELVYGPTGFVPQAETPIATTKNMCVLNNLQAGVTYDVYVRTNCGAGDESIWNGPISFTTNAQGVAIPTVSDFETTTDGWTLVNGTQRNQFVVGNATAYSGSKSLYISNDLGTSNAYSNNSPSTVYAYKLLHFEPGVYTASYYWKGLAEAGFDYGRAFLAPQNVTLTAGNTAFSNYSLPAGSIALDGNSELSDATSWSLMSTTFTISEPSDYKMVFGWMNDEMEGGPGALAIDSFAIAPSACYTPIVLADSILTTSAKLHIYFNGDSANVKVSTVAIADTQLESTTADVYDGKTAALLSLQNLNVNSNYYVYARGICPNGDTTAWAFTRFQTECLSYIIDETHSYTESFDSIPAGTTRVVPCWTMLSNDSSMMPSVVRLNSLPVLKLLSSDEAYSCAVTPHLEGSAVSDMKVSFKTRIIKSNCYLLVGVMSDPNDVKSFVKLDSITNLQPMYLESYEVNLSSYAGSGEYIAFMAGGSPNTGVYLDDVEISRQSVCAAPTVIKSTSIRDHSFNLMWNSTPEVTSWNVKIYSNAVDVDVALTADVMDTVVTSTKLSVTNVSGSSTYRVLIKSSCAGDLRSDWSDIHQVTTMCGNAYMPYRETFDAGIPVCWERYDAWLDSIDVNTPLEPVFHGWMIDSDMGLEGKHAIMNVYSGNIHSWLVTNPIVVDRGAKLSFDLALTGPDGVSAVQSSTGIDDDRFVVVVSTDNAQSWDTLHRVEWTDINGDYPYSTIPSTGSRCRIDLSRYMGNNIRVAFYAESAVGRADVYLHLDNVLFEPIEPVNIYDTVCQGYAYANHNFTIAASDLATAGNFSFSRVDTNSAGEDSVTVANLTVKPSSYSDLNATICDGEIYNLNGYSNLTTSGLYVLSLTSANGCDSIVSLNLVVAPTYDMTDSVRIQLSDLPYSYGDTTFVAGTVAGEYHYDYHGQTQQACDSLVHLVLTIDGLTAVGETGVINLSMYPNPIQKSGVTYIYGLTNAIDLNGVVVEVLNSVGQCVRTIRPTAQPIAVDGFETSGIYIVRVTTADGSVYFGKIMVQ